MDVALSCYYYIDMIFGEEFNPRSVPRHGRGRLAAVSGPCYSQSGLDTASPGFSIFTRTYARIYTNNENFAPRVKRFRIDFNAFCHASGAMTLEMLKNAANRAVRVLKRIAAACLNSNALSFQVFKSITAKAYGLITVKAYSEVIAYSLITVKAYSEVIAYSLIKASSITLPLSCPKHETRARS